MKLITIIAVLICVGVISIIASLNRDFSSSLKIGLQSFGIGLIVCALVMWGCYYK